MRIIALNVYKVTLPFRLTFAHSRKTARSVDNIVVEIQGADQEQRGYGEGGPRPYVTGETQHSAIDTIRRLTLNSSFPWDLKGIEQIRNFVGQTSRGKNRNAALCALEMALIDALGRTEGKNILEYLPRDHYTADIRYGATLPLAGHETIVTMCNMLKSFDIQEVRLKMGHDVKHNRRALEAVREALGPECDLRVDVNGGWDLALTLQHLPLLESQGVRVLEQPLPPQHNGWKDLASTPMNDIKLMADESICSMLDVEQAIAEGIFDIVNVRLSKCGGFFNSLKMIQRIREVGMEFQVGCQLGESGILSAAGRALCALSSDALYFDGSYDSFLLSDNLTTKHISFTHAGRAAPLTGPGLGITINREKLKRFSDSPLILEQA